MRNLLTSSTKIACCCVIATLLGTLIAPAANGAPVVLNNSFETPAFEVNTHNFGVNLVGTSWTHTGRSAIDNACMYGSTVTNCYATDGQQVAALQGASGYDYYGDGTVVGGVSSMAQNVYGFEIGKSYTISFDAMGINGFDGTNPFNVKIDGSDLFSSQLNPGTAAYTKYVSDPFVATAEMMNLMFYDAADTTGGKVTLIDDVQIEAYVPNLVTNGSFETPVIADNSHNYQTLGDYGDTQWTHTGRSGLDRGTVFGDCVAAEGQQMAFLQGDNGYTNGVTSLSQTISGLTVGEEYQLDFEAMAIGGSYAVNPFKVSVTDGGSAANVLFNDAYLAPGHDGGYESFADTFTATAESMTLSFYDAGNQWGGQVTFIDSVQVKHLASEVPEPATLSLLLVGALAMLAIRRRNA